MQNSGPVIDEKVLLERVAFRDSNAHSQLYTFYTPLLAKHQLIDASKRDQCFQKTIGRLECQERSNVSPLEDNLIYSEYLSLAEIAIDCLTPQRKKRFDMRTQQDMSIDEISGSLNISKSAVKKQLYAAIHFIKGVLEFRSK